MDNIIVVKILETNEDICCNELSLFLTEPPSTSNMMSKISTRHQVHNEVECLAILERGNHVDEEGMLQSRE